MRASMSALVAGVFGSAAAGSGDWSDWECPGFPCFIVNYFETRDYSDITQTCTPISYMTPCEKLAQAEKFAAVKVERYNWTNHETILGWHEPKRNHPCGSVDFSCTQVDSKGHTACLQGDNRKCRALCDDMKLLEVYKERCYTKCDGMCPGSSPSPPSPTPSRRRRSAPTPPPPTPAPTPRAASRRRRSAPSACTGGSLGACVKQCVATDDKNFKNCAKDGSTDCSASKCCQEKGAKCYVKNQYWSACKTSCDPSQIDPSDGKRWKCAVKSASDCGTFRGCIGTCESKCPSLSLNVNATRSSCASKCTAADEEAQRGSSCEKDGATDCSSSKCCKEAGAKCYVKNQYWSACKTSCDPSRVDPSDGKRWQCTDVTEPFSCSSYRDCIEGC